MTKPHAYFDRYPGTGDAAILCEGDVLGYETSLLRKWVGGDITIDRPIDIWACGTKKSIFGMCDAIGRCRPILVIEDRDFRTLSEAETECIKIKSEREKRNIRILAWKTWKRNEIENYFLDDEVVLPVLATWFGCSSDEVHDAIASLLPAWVPFQAVEFAVYRARQTWERSDPSQELRKKVNLDHKPKWSGLTNKLEAPDFGTVRANLEENLRRWTSTWIGTPGQALPQIGEILKECESKYEEWRNVHFNDPTWRVDWSGKDILMSILQYFSRAKGWPAGDSGSRVPIEWEKMNSTDRNELMREIEWEMQKDFIESFLIHITKLAGEGAAAEWSAIRQSLVCPF